MHKARIFVRLRVESAALKVVHNQISMISSRTSRGRASARRAGKMLAEQWPVQWFRGFARIAGLFCGTGPCTMVTGLDSNDFETLSSFVQGFRLRRPS